MKLKNKKMGDVITLSGALEFLHGAWLRNKKFWPSGTKLIFIKISTLFPSGQKMACFQGPDRNYYWRRHDPTKWDNGTNLQATRTVKVLLGYATVELPEEMRFTIRHPWRGKDSDDASQGYLISTTNDDGGLILGMMSRKDAEDRAKAI